MVSSIAVAIIAGLIADVDRGQLVAIGHALMISFMPAPPTMNISSSRPACLIASMAPSGDVVVLSPDGLDVGEAGRKSCITLKPSSRFQLANSLSSDLDAGAFDAGHEAVEALLVDRDRHAAQDDDVAAFGQRFLEVFGRVGAEARIVAGDIEVLDAVDRRARGRRR